jgi:hypothetical protein
MVESDQLLNGMEMRQDVPTVEGESVVTFHLIGFNQLTQEKVVNWVHPLFLEAKTKASKADNHN